MPTLLGEKLVMRILDKANLTVRLEDLGFRTDALAAFQRMLDQPHGLVLVTGPTGSGKTTTLYSALDLRPQPRAEHRHGRGPGRVPARPGQPDAGARRRSA